VGQNENRPLWRSLHSKGHTRVWYGFVPTNYAMLMAESSSFIIEVMQPRTW
jgi:hypothetical protein